MKRFLLALALLLAAAPAISAAPSPLETLRTAAGKGDAEAQFKLAQTYQLGKGVTRDAEMAVMWYRRAVAQGHDMASDELGFLLFSRGDRRAAMPYIERAAARGDPRAFYLLGTAHFNGDLASRDWPLAYAQTSRAAEAGLPAAKSNLQMMEQYLLPQDRAKADAILATLPPVRPAPGSAAARMAAAPAPAPAAPPPTPAAPPPPPASVKATGGWKVQLGALGSDAGAQQTWDKLARKVRELGVLDRRIIPSGSIRRLQGWGLASRADAQAVCAKVKAAGGDCLVLAP
jgi:TPR repeat protein